jgi:hypothetical protein
MSLHKLEKARLQLAWRHRNLKLSCVLQIELLLRSTILHDFNLIAHKTRVESVRQPITAATIRGDTHYRSAVRLLYGVWDYCGDTRRAHSDDYDIAWMKLRRYEFFRTFRAHSTAARDIDNELSNVPPIEERDFTLVVDILAGIHYNPNLKP